MGIASLDDDDDYAFHWTNRPPPSWSRNEDSMSRSNPNEHLANPVVKWFEWNGEKGNVRWYDKDAKQQVEVDLPFAFMLLDEVSTVGGWHDLSGSSIYANEVRDTTQETFVVKAFKGGTLGVGLWGKIRDSIKSVGGSYIANCYIAFKSGPNYHLGSIKFKGAALGAWMDFRKNNRAALYTKAVRIDQFAEGKKGRVIFRMPVFSLVDVTSEADAKAKALDAELQTFLGAYLSRNKKDQADGAAPTHVSDEDVAATTPTPAEISASDIPF